MFVDLQVGDSMRIGNADGIDIDKMLKKGSLHEKFSTGDLDAIIFEVCFTSNLFICRIFTSTLLENIVTLSLNVLRKAQNFFI